MADKREFTEIMELDELRRLFGLPGAVDLYKEGLDAEAATYAKVVTRLASHYLGNVLVALKPLDADRFELIPAPGYDWRDVAEYVAHLINLEADRAILTTGGALLKHGRPLGDPYPDFKEAILGHLGTIGRIPAIYGLGDPGDALRRALEDVAEVNKVRNAAA